MRRIPTRWRWLVYLVTFTAGITLFCWAVYGVLDWGITAIVMLMGGPAVGMMIWREERQETSGRDV